MAQLTGFQLGTDQVDTFLGSASSDGVFDQQSSGIYAAFIQTLNGANLIQATAEADSTSGLALATAIQSAGVVTGTDDDTINTWSQGNGFTALSYGGYKVFLLTDAGDDSVSLWGAAEGTTSAQGWGLSQGTIISGDGADTLVLTGSGTASNARGEATAAGYGAQNAFLNSGSGADSITLSGSAVLETATSGSSAGYGLNQGTVISGDGADGIVVSGNGSSQAGVVEATVLGYGLLNGFIASGAGDDQLFVVGEATRSGAGSTYGYAMVEATIDTAEGQDLVFISGSGSDIGVGAWYSTILTGDDDDSFFVVGDGDGYGVGLWETTVDTGDGNDIVMIAATHLAIYEAYVFTGSGDDWLEIGPGSGAVDGGDGYDLLVFDFFDPNTMEVTALDDGGLRISGSLDAAGNETAWSQDIYNIEAFQVEGQILSEAQVIKTFAAA